MYDGSVGNKSYIIKNFYYLPTGLVYVLVIFYAY